MNDEEIEIDLCLIASQAEHAEFVIKQRSELAERLGTLVLDLIDYARKGYAW